MNFVSASLSTYSGWKTLVTKNIKAILCSYSRINDEEMYQRKSYIKCHIFFNKKKLSSIRIIKLNDQEQY